MNNLLVTLNYEILSANSHDRHYRPACSIRALIHG